MYTLIWVTYVVYYWAIQLDINLYSLEALKYSIYVVIIAIFHILGCHNPGFRLIFSILWFTWDIVLDSTRPMSYSYGINVTVGRLLSLNSTHWSSLIQHKGHNSRFNHLGQDLQPTYSAGAVMQHCMPFFGSLMWYTIE